jgi:hypothetical protein
MNEELTKVIDTLAQKLGVASQFVVTELSKWMITNHLVWLAIGMILLFIAYKIFMIGVNRCKEQNRKIDDDYNMKLEDAKSKGKDLDFIYKACYDNIFEDDEYFVYWIIPGIMCIISIPMIIYGMFVMSWVIAPTGSTINYLLGVLK